MSPRGLGTDYVRSSESGDKESFLSLHLNRPLAGQRTYDILSTVAFLGEKVELEAFGPVGVAALHAAALDTKIKSVTINDALISWASVVNTPKSEKQLSNVVPGVLAYYDLPDLARLIAPRPLTIHHPVDAAGKPVGKEELERAFAEARKVYAKHKASDNLKLEASNPTP